MCVLYFSIISQALLFSVSSWHDKIPTWLKLYTENRLTQTHTLCINIMPSLNLLNVANITMHCIVFIYTDHNQGSSSAERDRPINKMPRFYTQIIRVDVNVACDCGAFRDLGLPEHGTEDLHGVYNHIALQYHNTNP